MEGVKWFWVDGGLAVENNGLDTWHVDPDIADDSSPEDLHAHPKHPSNMRPSSVQTSDVLVMHAFYSSSVVILTVTRSPPERETTSVQALERDSSSCFPYKPPSGHWLASIEQQ
jgi:hypothetical protein